MFTKFFKSVANRLMPKPKGKVAEKVDAPKKNEPIPPTATKLIKPEKPRRNRSHYSGNILQYFRVLAGGNQGKNSQKRIDKAVREQYTRKQWQEMKRAGLRKRRRENNNGAFGGEEKRKKLA